MTPTESTKKAGPKKTAQPELTEAEQQELLEQDKQTRERRAENQLELAKLFLAKEKPEIARRRLKEIVVGFDGTSTAIKARKLLKTL